MTKPITHTSVLLTEDCNFRCDYCFIKRNPQKINWETMKAIIDWQSKNNNERAELHLQFFGGEPTLMWDIIEQSVAYAKSKPQKFRFGMTTNGSLLYPERIEFLEKEQIEVLFSIDGLPKVHDMHRKLPDGTGTWKLIETPVKSCIKKNLSPVGRLTYTPETLPYLYDSIVFLLDELEFKYVAPTPAIDSYKPFAEKDYEEWDRQYEKINKVFKQKLLSGKNPGLSYNEKCFRQMIRGVKMTSPCGAGKSYAGINYKGEIFPCHRFVQWPEWKMGNVWDGITRPEIRNITKDFNINLSNPKCASCDNGFCGGTCLAANYENNGSIWIPSKDGCRISKKQWDNAKKLYNELKDTQQFKKIYSRYQSVKVNSKKPKNYVNLSSLNERLNKMEKTVYSMSQVLLDIAEKEENTNG